MKCPLLIDSSNFWLAGLTTEPVNRASQPLPAVQLPLQASPKFLSSSPKFRPIKFFCRRESWREKSSTNLFAFIRKKPEKIQKKKKVAEFDSVMKKLVSGSRPRTRCLCNSESPAPSSPSEEMHRSSVSPVPVRIRDDHQKSVIGGWLSLDRAVSCCREVAARRPDLRTPRGPLRSRSWSRRRGVRADVCGRRRAASGAVAVTPRGGSARR
jgi:hypothetical protein